jgi:NADPH2:quinone reductase
VYGSGGDIGITRDGSHARYLVLPEQALRAKPQGISMDEAGAVGVPFVTAYEGFRRSGMPQAGQTVLVLGANGKVGQAAVQLASQAGARVIAVQRHAGPFEGFASGAVDVIDARHHADVGARVRELTDGRGAHIVYNTVGSAYFEAANKAMAKGATQIFIATHDRAVPFDIFAFYRGMHTFVGIDSLAMDCVASTAQLDAMRDGFERGTLKPFPVARSFTLDEALDAYRLVLSGSTDRVVLRP